MSTPSAASSSSCTRATTSRARSRASGSSRATRSIPKVDERGRSCSSTRASTRWRRSFSCRCSSSWRRARSTASTRRPRARLRMPATSTPIPRPKTRRSAPGRQLRKPRAATPCAPRPRPSSRSLCLEFPQFGYDVLSESLRLLSYFPFVSLSPCSLHSRNSPGADVACSSCPRREAQARAQRENAPRCKHAGGSARKRLATATSKLDTVGRRYTKRKNGRRRATKGVIYIFSPGSGLSFVLLSAPVRRGLALGKFFGLRSAILMAGVRQCLLEVRRTLTGRASGWLSLEV